MSPLDHVKEFTTTIFSTPKSRRAAIKSIATGMTVATLSGCVSIRKPKQTIVTYTNEPENLIPGEPNYYATSHELNGDVNALVATTHEGRPTKLDGNPLFPNNNGSSTGYIQAEIQNLYDPDRLKENRIDGKKTTPTQIKKHLNLSNKKTLIVLPKTASILNQDLLKTLSRKNTHVIFVDPVNRDQQTHAIKDITGSFGYVDFDFKKTNVIVSFSHDFLGLEKNTLASLNDYVQNQDHITTISFSHSLNITDSKADSVINTSIVEQEHAIAYITQKITAKYGTLKQKQAALKFKYKTKLINKTTLDLMITKLLLHRGHGIVTAGELHNKNTHKALFLLNSVLKNINKTIYLLSESSYRTGYQHTHGFKSGIEAISSLIDNSSINQLISLDVDLTRFIPNLSDKLSAINTVYLTAYKNSFSTLANVVISKTHFLEDWGLLLSRDGHICIQQPTIMPLYNSSLSTTDVLLAIAKKPVSTYRYLIQKISDIGHPFYHLKKEGFIRGKNKKLQIKTLSLEKNNPRDNTRHLTIVPSYQLYDGRYSNNAWLNETPDPVSKLTWGNAFYISPSFAKENELATGNVVRIQLGNGVLVSGPVIILPGQNHESITVNYGFGQSNDGRFSGFGINVDALTPNESYALTRITKTGETVTLADTQMNHGLDEEQLAASGIKNRIKKILQIKSVDEINHPHHDSHHIHSLFKEQDYKGTHQWGMSIDLNACLGCGACSISCQAENNIPVVGREQVIKGREMSWLRIDRYFMENDNNETTINFMPVACVHCENAPCEQVCPVNATVHDDEGLNVMTYNRCIGTRYCANNCPYKVRRFNFFDWHQTNPQAVKKDRIHLFDYFKQPAKSTQMQFNPDVTIRMRGVMEKCTYCLQRISQAKIKSKNTGSNEPITSLKTACQQSCATGAIVFGDIANKSSDVSKKRKSKRRYDLLQTELNTKPRTIYLVKVKRTVWGTEKEAAHGHH